MKMFLLGMLVMYLIASVVILILNTINVDEDTKDLVFGWWLMPIVIAVNKIIKNIKKSVDK